MKKFSLATLLISVIVGLTVSSAFGQDEDDPPRDKRAQTGMKFLNFSIDARAAAMGDALTAQDHGSAVSMFYNPASMASQTGLVSAAFGFTQWIADINYSGIAVAYQPAGGLYGVFGISVLTVNYGDLEGTVRADNDAGFLSTGTFSPAGTALGLGYARALTDRFSVGGNVKLVSEDLGSSAVEFEDPDLTGEGRYVKTNLKFEDNKQSIVAFDFGVLYRTGFRSLIFAMSARNFAGDVTYAEESFDLPLTFRIGLSMNLMDFTGMDQDIHSFVLAIDTERPRDFSEQIKIGGEYVFMNTLALRGGFILPTDEQGIMLGFGVQRSGFSIDYAYSQFGVFGAVNRFGLQASF
ncbi:MAG: PorV/PorQ family protein [Candidatus Marinimicrobia bacterium]|nr:PorV/PorQ family protein [Candidatus Neomarinimicrobiota bacterium]